MNTHDLVQQELMKETRTQLKKRSDFRVNYFITCFFIIGLLLAFYHHTWLIAIGSGGLLLVVYYTSKNIFPGANFYQYVLSVVLGIFTLQYVYQVQEMIEMYFFACIASAILIIYQNWKLQIPLAIVALVHPALLWYKFSGAGTIYFPRQEPPILHFIIMLTAFEIIIFCLCGFHAYNLKKAADKNISQSFEIDRLKKLAEENLKKRLKEIADYKYALDESSIIAVTDQNGIITHVNDNFCRISKYREDELIGQDHRIINSGHHSKDFIHQLWITIATGKIWRGELKNKAKDGTCYWVDTTIVPFLNERGDPYQYMAIRADITARKLTEKKLEEANAELSKIFNTIDEVLYSVDLVNCRFIQISESCEKIYGYTAGQLLADIHLFSEIIHPCDKNLIEENIAKLQEGKTVINQYRILHKNKGTRWIEAKIIPTRSEDGMVRRADGISKDITEKKLAEESLQKSQANQHTIFDNTDTGYLLIDTDLKIISFNEQAGNFAKQHLQQNFAVGLYSIDCFVPARKAILEKMMQEALRGNKSHYEINYPQQDGSTRWYDINMFGVSNKEGGIFEIVFSVREITERKRAEHALKQLNNTLEKRAAELVASNEELERFTYVVSHDLQEPLRMVNSFLQLLNNKYSHQLDEAAHQYINYAVGGADRMKTLILDLLDFSRISTIKKEHVVIDLNALVKNTLHVLRISLDESRAQVIVGKMPEVYGNESQLTQLFQNVIGNALKYRCVNDATIEIGFTEKGNMCEFFVKDNGIGIDAVHFDKIFVIFQRLHSRTAYSGTGIGLAISKKIVELHHGKIWVESSKGNGSTFYFTIPKLRNPY